VEVPTGGALCPENQKTRAAAVMSWVAAEWGAIGCVGGGVTN